jgi:hypothetical protein
MISSGHLIPPSRKPTGHISVADRISRAPTDMEQLPAARLATAATSHRGSRQRIARLDADAARLQSLHNLCVTLQAASTVTAAVVFSRKQCPRSPAHAVSLGLRPLFFSIRSPRMCTTRLQILHALDQFPDFAPRTADAGA